jgi:hypothetical protein
MVPSARVKQLKCQGNFAVENINNCKISYKNIKMLKIRRYMTMNWYLCVNAIEGVLKNQTKTPVVFAA